MRTATVGTILIVLLAMSCAFCATRPVAYSHMDPQLGGPSYRVFDANEVDSIDDIPALRALFRIAEECSGETGNFRPIRVFAVSQVSVKDDNTGTWHNTGLVGVWARGTPWIYVLEGRTPAQTSRTIVHEFVHYITGKGHPESDAQNRACDEYQTKGHNE